MEILGIATSETIPINKSTQLYQIAEYWGFVSSVLTIAYKLTPISINENTVVKKCNPLVMK